MMNDCRNIDKAFDMALAVGAKYYCTYSVKYQGLREIISASFFKENVPNSQNCLTEVATFSVDLKSFTPYIRQFAYSYIGTEAIGKDGHSQLKLIP